MVSAEEISLLSTSYGPDRRLNTRINILILYYWQLQERLRLIDTSRSDQVDNGTKQLKNADDGMNLRTLSCSLSGGWRGEEEEEEKKESE